MTKQGIPKPNFTQIPNVVIEDWMSKLSGAEYKIITLILRETIGYHRRKASISYNDFSKKCGVSRRWVITATKKFENLGWIKVLPSKENIKNIYEILVQNELTVPASELTVLVNSVHHDSELSTPPLVNSVHHYTERPKERVKEISKESLKEIYKEKTSELTSHSVASAPSDNVCEKITSKSKSPKKGYGHELACKLTDIELQKLIEQFGKDGTRERINNLALYVTAKGDKYKSHYSAILTWENKNKSDAKKSNPSRVLDNTTEKQQQLYEELF